MYALCVCVCFQDPFNRVRYSLFSSGTGQNLFRIEPNSGRVFVQRALSQDSSNDYFVSQIHKKEHGINYLVFCKSNT